MKMNWGHKLTIGMVAFMLFISYMVYRMASSKVDLVADDYYEDGVEYQQRIEKIKNADKVKDNIRVTYDAGRAILSVILPVSSEGTVYLYRASDKRSDFSIKAGQNPTLVSFSGRPKGTWKAIVDWKTGDAPFLFEKEFIVE